MLESIKEFLQVETNLAALGWIGAVVSAAAAALWTVFRFFWSKNSTISAENNSIAAGRDVKISSTSNQNKYDPPPN